MSSGGGSPPPAPGMSLEERDLLTKQGITLDQFNQILQQSTSDSADSQNILRQLSGLYKNVTIPASSQEFFDQSKVGDISTPSGRRPPMLEELNRARTDLDYARSQGWTSTKNTPEQQKMQIDQVALDDLKARVATATQQQQQISDLQNKRYITALEGNAPVSQGLIQRKMDDFKTLKEGAAKRGILIEGDDPESATSQSSAGNELMGQFKRTYGLLEDSERQAQLAGGAPDSSGAYSTPIGFASSSVPAGPSGLLGSYSSLGSSYGSMTQPYQNQRMLGYNSELAGYTAGNQTKAGLTGLLGTGAGYAAMSSHPAIGAGLLGLGMLSSLR